MTNILDTGKTPTWCPGCGAFSVSAALKKSITQLNLEPKDVVICYDIGCSGNMSNILNVCAVETLHGRSVPVAVGIKSVRADLAVIAQAGDGGMLSEGLNHFVHAIQRDDNITLILNNNYVFGLTAGQKSSATPKGVKARAQQDTNKVEPISAVNIAVATGCRFIARIPSDNIKLLQETIERAIQFNGFALIEIIQPCKIWAKTFPQTEFVYLDEPMQNATELLDKENLAGLLYLKN